MTENEIDDLNDATSGFANLLLHYTADADSFPFDDYSITTYHGTDEDGSEIRFADPYDYMEPMDNLLHDVDSLDQLSLFFIEYSDQADEAIDAFTKFSKKHVGALINVGIQGFVKEILTEPVDYGVKRNIVRVPALTQAEDAHHQDSMDSFHEPVQESMF